MEFAPWTAPREILCNGARRDNVVRQEFITQMGASDRARAQVLHDGFRGS